MKNFVSVDWLKQHLNDKDIVVIDCRLDLHDADRGLSDYNKAHIPNAFFLDINTVFSGEKKVHGGKRPLPIISELIKALEEIGINNDSKVVVYDEVTMSSARAFWTLKYLGHDKVYILNGGLNEWERAGYELSSEVPPTPEKASYKESINDSLYCDIDYIQSQLYSNETTKIDARAYERFTGEYEPFYSKKGHIPNSINHHSKLLLDENGRLKDMDELKESLNYLRDLPDLVVYCGSAINASLNYAVLDEVGIKSKLYVGSVSDWISYEENDLEMSE